MFIYIIISLLLSLLTFSKESNEIFNQLVFDSEIKNDELKYFQVNNLYNTNNQDLENQNQNNFTINSTADYKYKKIDILFNNLKNVIDQYSIISFDIFDTLLIRPYVNSKDLFVHLENLNNATGYAKSRIEAERNIRKKKLYKNEEITFDEIYQQIEPKYKWLKEKELELEYNSLKARSFLKDVYNYAIFLKKRVIIISDMYLSKNFLEKVLRKCGYNNYEHLFVSSEYGKTKSSGLLYNIILKELNISPKDILHIGDNLRSDISKSREKGINAFHIPKVVEYLFELDPRIKEFYINHSDNLGASILLGLLASHNENAYKNYWYEFGYKYAGPVIFGYMQWLDEKIKKDGIKKVIFVARDGYTLEKVFNLIKISDSKTYYIYFPRKIAKKCLYGQPKEVKNSRKEYLLYLNQFDLNDNNLAIVDSITNKYTSQRGLLALFPKKDIKGYYWFVGKEKFKNLNFESYQKDHKHRIGDLIELFMTAPTPPIDTITNGKPIFKEASNAEIIRIKLYPELSNGAIDFTLDYLKCFSILKSFFTSEMLIEWVNIFLYTPTEIDKNMFFTIEHAPNDNHSKYFKLFNHWYYKNGKTINGNMNKFRNKKNFKKHKKALKINKEFKKK
ncbi:Haloacid dehalogenase-like hydrolase-domain-containing protein [Neocallimastix lanati (nom. inval.)]|uniref:HAD-superfamily hydrolase n=1 Tax=Neocallimastix californiae TaxID=1754190 RepID=A0A1Y1ZU48_9FUNG|nr:Haloacid dehalogenase-like hydrolase-domain-containing protein [Neocallimastix sp. JGI-2020a]ORY13783.1 hypothetical protein LY90DRAFT_518146 [Neocallimastix californiae]|eukprot:ORY13783.1 hypothetical protein LY90DRAFT_518146 [Neocallimastix californiae]